MVWAPGAHEGNAGVVLRFLKLFVVVVVVVSGCDNRSLDELSYAEQMEFGEEMYRRCLDQGVKMDTPEMRDCFRAEGKAELARRERRKSAGAAMVMSSQAYGSNVSRNYGTPTYQKPVNCTSNRIGNSVQTSCY